MRFILLLLALGAIGWVLYQVSGGGKAESVIPADYQQSLEKAHGVEQTIQEAAELRLQQVEEATD